MNPAPFTPLEKASSVRTRLKEVNQSFERNLKPFANFLTGFIMFYTYLLKNRRKSFVNYRKGAG